MDASFVHCADNTLRTCCVESNNNISLTSADSFLPSEKGNITITYDVTDAYSSYYLAKVSLHFTILGPYMFI